MIIPVNFKGKLAAEGDFENWLDEWIKHITFCLKTVGVENVEGAVNKTKEKIIKLLEEEKDSDVISLALGLPSSFYSKVNKQH